MEPHPIELLINKADSAINQEDFDTLVEIYTDDAILVVKPGLNAMGKQAIRKAFEAITLHFNHSLNVRQAGIRILESDDTALVLANTVVSSNDMPPTNRNATYVFTRKLGGNWHCAIDNSYGHELLSHQDA